MMEDRLQSARDDEAARKRQRLVPRPLKFPEEERTPRFRGPGFPEGSRRRPVMVLRFPKENGINCNAKSSASLSR